MDTMTYVFMGAGVFLLFVYSWFYISCFQKCGPNQAMIISGWGAGEGDRKFRIVVGGGAFINPLMQQKSFVSLETMTVDVISSTPMITRNRIPLEVVGVAQIKVQNNDEAIAIAAELFLNKDAEQIAGIAQQTLIGHVRAILGTLTVDEFLNNSEMFSQKVQMVSAADLQNMGMEIVSFTIKEVKDTVGYIEELAKREVEQLRAQAAAELSSVKNSS